MIDDKKTEIAINLVKRFFIFDLADRNAPAAVACLSRHIELIGAGIGGEIFGLTAARDYIEGDIVKHPRGYSILFAEERAQSICDGVSVVTLKIVIVALAVTLEYRVSATVCPEEGRFKIRLLHMSLLEKNADRDMLFHSAVSECYAGELWKELVDEYLVGGIVGGYCEPGFPFYMVNQMLLDILGYDDEADFVRDIDGLIENTIHPSDYPRVLAEVTEQLRDGGQYQSQYRMRRKDGKYIWVDDRGRNLKTNDGRYAIISICTVDLLI